jgi:two-component system, NtrC family, sensor histidine kinase HydH
MNAVYERKKFNWMDLLSLAFLAALAILPPIGEIHKQLILPAIGVLQINEGRLIAWLPKRGRTYVVLLKLLLATLLLSHTNELSINSSYYPIFYLPVVTAAVYFGPVGTLLWTLLASALYCSYLYPALQTYELTSGAVAELVMRNLFFFLAAIIVNGFATENRRQTHRYQFLAEQLAETNRRLEQAQDDARRSERLAALGQLSAGLAHELRNPLGIIKGSAEMLSQQVRSTTPIAAELAGFISGEVERMSSLVTRFLDFARPLRLQLQPRPLEAAVDRAIQDVTANWHGPQIEVQRHYETNLPAVMLDQDLSERVFINLVQNAYEAMSETGGGTLSVAITRVEHDGRQGVQVKFTDSGPGVPAALHEEIFNPFMTTKKTGVGLGLSIVSKIMDEHGGSIALVAAPSGGASFVLFFPAAAATVTPDSPATVSA